MASDFVLRSFRSFDGTEIAYQLAGGGAGRLPVVLANGLGGDYRAWKHIFDRFADGRALATWDYRGLYRSGPPRTPGTLGPPAQAKDLEALVDELGWQRFILVGWSMGVQVNFEAWRRLRARVAAVCAINGVAGKPFETALGSRILRHVIPSLLKQMRRRAKLVSRVTGLATSWSGLLPTMQRLGMVGATIDLALFGEFAKTFSTLDFDLYCATLEALGRHDAHDVLGSLDVPFAIVTGDRDLLTPVSTAKRMARDIRDARLRVLAGGTHYTPVEYPEEVCAELSRLFAEADSREGERCAG